MKKHDSLSSKVYLDIVKQLKEMIENDGLLPGDKIPSERELSERLQAGRSSVREALRSLELLGLIETRRGEGTYIKNFQEHKLVEILGGFFLQEEKSKVKLTETKHLIEMNCLHLVINDASDSTIEELMNWANKNNFDDFTFFQHIASLHDNRLMERIWTAIGSYEKAVVPHSFITSKEPYLMLLEQLMNRNEKEVISIYVSRIRNMSNGI